ncbi:hypothetical protein BDP55DRAFT_638548 [Colletotrichum godetiae]|uniref:Uncharacterized protein n=1 Tax=Colletotrichum godetiae TaxID=1209918 RepID=A0AAJ0ENJ5_9PEZI|nr:uncharacterized protein BDP55DRAFT_638548 [Colletotrichum godetiae]KAK1657647.1 hypothetical protein BDP55DRAFT_638548 [Colletotrichum godetiae]
MRNTIFLNYATPELGAILAGDRTGALDSVSRDSNSSAERLHEVNKSITEDVDRFGYSYSYCAHIISLLSKYYYTISGIRSFPSLYIKQQGGIRNTTQTHTQSTRPGQSPSRAWATDNSEIAQNTQKPSITGINLARKPTGTGMPKIKSDSVATTAT